MKDFNDHLLSTSQLSQPEKTLKEKCYIKGLIIPFGVSPGANHFNLCLSVCLNNSSETRQKYVPLSLCFSDDEYAGSISLP